MHLQSVAPPLKTFKNVIFITGLIIVSSLVSCRQTLKENPDHTAHTDSLMWHVDDLQNSDHPARSLVYLDSAYQVFPNPGRIDLWRKYKQKTNYYLNYDFNLKKARNYADSMAMMLDGEKKTPDEKHAYAWTLFTVGNLFVAEKKYAEAFKSFYEGREYAQKNLDNCSYCQFTYQLGMVRYNQKQYGKGISYFKQALKENNLCKTTPGSDNAFYIPQSTLNTIALCYEHTGQPDSAISYYRRTLELIDQRAPFCKDQRFAATAKGVVYGNLGGIYAKLNNYTEAKKYLKESIRINDRPGYEVNDSQTAKLKLADLDIRSGQYPAADSLLKELEVFIARRPAQHQRNEDIRIKWYRLKWQYYNRTKQSPLAYAYVQKYDALRDSVADANKGLDNADMDAAFKANEQQYQVALLSKDNQIKKYSLRIIIFCLPLVIGILFFIWQNLKRSRKHVAALTRLNQQISQQNTQMQHTLNALEQSQADNTRMMQIVAHDLRSPIGGMTMIASLMLQNEQLAPEDQEMLQLIKTSGENSLALVSDLLQVHLSAEEMKMEPVDLQAMLRYCVELLHYKAETKAQQINLQAKPVTLNVNREKLWRVISNLIANAIKFSPTGSRIEVSMEETSQSVMIKVKDHGIGIPEDIADKIFDMFTEAKRPGTEGERAFGLGLAISKQIVLAHGGNIWFESKPGDGTTFFVELPVG